jgi:hypothetical protein
LLKKWQLIKKFESETSPTGDITLSLELQHAAMKHAALLLAN